MPRWMRATNRRRRCSNSACMPPRWRPWATPLPSTWPSTAREFRMTFDAVIVGGSFAGLSAAMMLARARRSVLVIDSGLPRNRFSSHSHGVLGLDGISGGDLLRQAKAQLLDYPSVRWANDTATDAQPTVDGFAV